MSNIASNLKYLRKKKGHTQQQFADLMEIKRSLVGAYEEDRAEPKYELLIKSSFWSYSRGLVKSMLRKSPDHRPRVCVSSPSLRIAPHPEI